MPNEGLQRTLLVGLGQMGAKTVDRLLAELGDPFSQMSLIQGIAVLTEDIPLNHIGDPLQVSSETPFDAWRVDFEKQVEQALHRISQLNNLTQLAQQGLSLRHPDEIHVMVVANLAEPWPVNSLTSVLQLIRDAVSRTLNCYVGISGLMFVVNPTEGEAVDDETLEVLPTSEIWSLANEFDRGYFVAGLTNEVGLILGPVDDLIERSVYFLALLLREMAIAHLTWEDNNAAGWGLPLTSFGLATVRWPGGELAEVMSQRWTAAMLNQQLTLPQVRGPSGDLAQQAREAAQQSLTRDQLAPPLLIDRLSTQMPMLPNHLAELVPDPPWPWLISEIQTRLEQAIQRWQDEWQTASKVQLKTTLTELETGWVEQAQIWLAQQVDRHKTGMVLATQSYLAAVSELLAAFVEGVEQNLEEAQADLANIEQQLGGMAEALAGAVSSFPGSPLAAVLSWGWRPPRWPAYWHKCHQAQTMARNYAHLSRGRLATLQILWYYEEILPLYRNLLALWKQYVVEAWDGACKQVRQAAQVEALQGWPEQQQDILIASAGPWQEGLVEALYQQAIELHADSVWEAVGTFSSWVAEGVDTEALLHRLLKHTSQALQSTMILPVDQLLGRQFPDEETRAGWLAALAEQARPFWQYDETTLAESSRANVRLETWLLLPGGEDSPLVNLTQNWPHPPQVFTTRRPEEMAVVTIKQIYREDWDGEFLEN